MISGRLMNNFMRYTIELQSMFRFTSHAISALPVAS